MPQLVGAPCVFCQQRIDSDWEGSFCPACGCPSHNACREDRNAPAAENVCPTCGAPRTAIQSAARERKEEVTRQVAEGKQRLGLKVIGFGGIALVIGVVRLLGRLAGGPPEGVGDLVDVLFLFALGSALVIYGFFKAAANAQ